MTDIYICIYIGCTAELCHSVYRFGEILWPWLIVGFVGFFSWLRESWSNRESNRLICFKLSVMFEEASPGWTLTPFACVFFQKAREPSALCQMKYPPADITEHSSFFPSVSHMLILFFFFFTLWHRELIDVSRFNSALWGFSNFSNICIHIYWQKYQLEVKSFLRKLSSLVTCQLNTSKCDLSLVLLSNTEANCCPQAADVGRDAQ